MITRGTHSVILSVVVIEAKKKKVSVPSFLKWVCHLPIFSVFLFEISLRKHDYYVYKPLALFFFVSSFYIIDFY